MEKQTNLQSCQLHPSISRERGSGVTVHTHQSKYCVDNNNNYYIQACLLMEACIWFMNTSCVLYLIGGEISTIVNTVTGSSEDHQTKVHVQLQYYHIVQNMQPICLSNLNFFRIFFQTVKALSMVVMSVLEHLPGQSHTGVACIIFYGTSGHASAICISTRTIPSTIVYILSWFE